MQFWNNFAAKHPAAAKWVREGGLFVVVSNLITVFKYLLLQFLPKAFASLPVVDFGWPGIPVPLFGETEEIAPRVGEVAVWPCAVLAGVTTGGPGTIIIRAR